MRSAGRVKDTFIAYKKKQKRGQVSYDNYLSYKFIFFDFKRKMYRLEFLLKIIYNIEYRNTIEVFR